MVSIGKQNWLTQGILQIGQNVQSPSSGVKFTGGGGTKVNSLQERLAAIDRGETPSIASSSSYGRVQGNTLMERLDSIGTGELSPKFGTNEKKFDWTM